MTSLLIVPPQVQPITLAEAKAHLRVSSDVEDELIADLSRAATQMLEGETGLALISQTWRFWLDALPPDGIICLPQHPVQRIQQVTWYDAHGTPTVLDGGAYYLNTLTRPARLRFDRASCPMGMCNGIEIDFDAGFGSVGTDTPDMLRRALLALIAHWYEFRGAYSADDQPVSVPEIYMRLTRHHRRVQI
ncbi:MAG: phage head-tail connector protein [Pseudomonadota bacterium]